jgi:FAD:protein FMN transferase
VAKKLQLLFKATELRWIMKLIIPTAIAYLLLINCNSQNNNTITINGDAQGTTYHIIYFSESNVNLEKGIDSILKRIDSSLSTYVSSSIISRVNKNDTTVIIDEHFIEVFNTALEVSKNTKGIFDPTVAPLINAWGFGFTKKSKVDSSLVDSLLDFIGYQKVRLSGKKVIKDKLEVMLDFNAIAQGYTVDVLATYLEKMSVVNYLVELGGEVKAKGKKQNDQFWTIGIDQPNEEAIEGRPLKAVVTLKNKALATSGNYRKFYIEDGKKFSHIIDPFTGYPAKHNLLSATVVANDCMSADAYATSFMVMGMEKAKEFLSAHEGLQLEVFFIYDEGGIWKTYSSKKLEEWIKELP